MSEIKIACRVWCHLCEENVEMVRVRSAARLFDLNSRTLYRYIERGSVHSVKVAGKSLRVCRACLAKAVIQQSRGITRRGAMAWCLKCNRSVELLSVLSASRSAAVATSTVYRYISDQTVSSIKVPGKPAQVCASCLLKHNDGTVGRGSVTR